MMTKNTPESCHLLMTDTDSLVYHIKTDDVYDDMKDIKYMLDTSEYPPTHPLYDSKNKKVIGKFKDECVEKGQFKTISEFVGLRPKMYSLITDDEVSKSKAKGVQKRITKSFSINVYRNTLALCDRKYNTQVSLRSFDHVVHTIQQNKVSLCAYDDKRWIESNGITSLAYGHYKISK